MKIFSSPQFVLPLPATHRFPMQKYALLRERVLAQLAPPHHMIAPPSAANHQVTLAHDATYLGRLEAGALTANEIRKIGFPWSPELVARERLVTGATIAACRAALADGVAVNLAGGTHHAHRDWGAGYCVFNDSAVAARVMQAEGRALRVAIIDGDVHQGDGTAAILEDDASIFTFSIHGAKNFPFHKARSDLDIALPDGAADDAFLSAFAEGLRHSLSSAHADLAIYLAGADPFVGDALGRLALSKAGLAERDRLLLDTCGAFGVPVAISMAGGYARNVDDIVDIHFETVRLAGELS